MSEYELKKTFIQNPDDFALPEWARHMRPHFVPILHAAYFEEPTEEELAEPGKQNFYVLLSDYRTRTGGGYGNHTKATIRWSDGTVEPDVDGHSGNEQGNRVPWVFQPVLEGSYTSSTFQGEYFTVFLQYFVTYDRFKVILNKLKNSNSFYEPTRDRGLVQHVMGIDTFLLTAIRDPTVSSYVDALNSARNKPCKSVTLF